MDSVDFLLLILFAALVLVGGNSSIEAAFSKNDSLGSIREACFARIFWRVTLSWACFMCSLIVLPSAFQNSGLNMTQIGFRVALVGCVLGASVALPTAMVSCWAAQWGRQVAKLGGLFTLIPGSALLWFVLQELRD